MNLAKLIFIGVLSVNAITISDTDTDAKYEKVMKRLKRNVRRLMKDMN